MAGTVVIPAPAHPVRALVRWAAEHCPEGGKVMDVGAGEHASGDLGPLRRRHAMLVGTDPDPAIERNTSLAERHRLPVEELGPEHAGRYDVVLTIFVLEHVEDPLAFASSCARLIRPGGSWFALTLNVRHYFGATAWATNRLGIQPAVLQLFKGAAAEHDHRFPTRYRFNSRRTVERVCTTVGFETVEYRVYDAPDRYAWYLPRPVNRLPAMYSSVAYRVGWPSLMGHLSFRAQRP
ncbi:MAG: methyltransferase domain-containing protein [Actinomycetota bacterium]|nr:methyltransferase domain-containing protein [Actinomycetota bacterium]